MNSEQGLEAIAGLPLDARLDPLTELARGLLDNGGVPSDTALPIALMMVEVLDSSEGTGRQRMEIGELLGRLGDPRLHSPDQPEYWTTVELEDGSSLRVGRYPVTTQEIRGWFDSGADADQGHWTDEGWAWRGANQETWLQLADLEEHRSLVFPNQPVVGVTFHEAQAYARSHGARLPTMTERRWIVRGPERRPYPWGQPFGSGNANTREEALGKPCAVGLYRTDSTPDGVCDLAGNVAEWTLDGGGDRRVIHPGSWVHPAMASWAKALEMLPPESRVGDLGFRLVRE